MIFSRCFLVLNKIIIQFAKTYPKTWIGNLKRLGITHVLNMAQELDLDADYAKHGIKLVNIEAKDAKTYNIRQDFDRAFSFIDSALQSQGKIVINCARGISRSATIVIGFLMFRFNMSLNEAYSLLSKLRPHARPNSNFRRQLELFEQELAYLKFARDKGEQKPKRTISSHRLPTSGMFLDENATAANKQKQQQYYYVLSSSFAPSSS